MTDAAEIIALRTAGMTYQVIADRLGISKQTVWYTIHPDAAERRRAQSLAAKKRRQKPCPQCGRLVSYDRPGELCRKCAHETEYGERNRRIVAAWNRGEPTNAIAAREDMTAGAVLTEVDRWRKRGSYDIALRHRRHRDAWPYVEERWNANASVAEIAVGLGTTPENVRQMVGKMRRAGIHIEHRDVHRTNIEAEARRAEIVRRWNAGESVAEIAAALQTSLSSIAVAIYRMRRKGYDLPYRHPRFQEKAIA